MGDTGEVRPGKGRHAEGSPKGHLLACLLGVPVASYDELYACNERQWLLEIASRRCGSRDEVGALKRRIDENNLRRHQTIDAIDESLDVSGRGEEGSPIRSYSETIGELLERSTILELKARYTRDARQRARATDLILHLVRVGEQLRQDLDEGCASLPPRVGSKEYGEADR